ncbi:hypothetical protein HPB48_005549 [Haemaphysalis longicornis]|uniref:Lipase domain-containing protein n=1 Tax=Haemaphysalis longicornis TaxID=44386 RepID=A0A9J6H506_HAELO|nr:hypothetical protein HPB48_005549 [Haemaphysalis longicornis]
MFGASSPSAREDGRPLAQVVALLAGAACFACCWFAVSDVLLAPAGVWSLRHHKAVRCFGVRRRAEPVRSLVCGGELDHPMETDARFAHAQECWHFDGRTRRLLRLPRLLQLRPFYPNLHFREDNGSGLPNALPEEPGSIGTRFYLSSRRSREPRLLGDAAYFNASKPVKLIIHGFGSSGKRSWVRRMVDALLTAGGRERGGGGLGERRHAAQLRAGGRQRPASSAARWRRPCDGSCGWGRGAATFHLVGFSLGAHVAGFAGAELRNLSRITGLDPAAPLFEGYDEASRLDPSDAKLVDVIHSNGDSFLRGGLGAFEPLGHVDYYPNGGKVQLGCNSVFVGALSDIFWGHWQSLCHHRRALQLFTESASPLCPFPAFQCASYESFQKGDCFPCERPADCSYMGYFADRSKARGRMFLMTRHDEPFCASQYKLIVNSSADQEPSWGKIELELFAESGANETFSVTTDGHELKAGQGDKVLVAAHPAVVNITRVVIKYTKYRGWIYGGKDSWFIDKVAILDSFGYTVSYCGLRTRLPDGQPVKLRVRPEDCQPPPSQRVARLIWQVLSDPVLGSQPRPPRLVWTLRLEDAAEAAASATALVGSGLVDARPLPAPGQETLSCRISSRFGATGVFPSLQAGLRG